VTASRARPIISGRFPAIQQVEWPNLGKISDIPVERYHVAIPLAATDPT